MKKEYWLLWQAGYLFGKWWNFKHWYRTKKALDSAVLHKERLGYRVIATSEDEVDLSR